MALSIALPVRRRRRIAATLPVAAVVTTETEPAETPQPVPVAAPITNPFRGLEAALTEGQARLQLMRGLRGLR